MELEWQEVKGQKRTHELRAGEQVLARLAYPSLWKSDAVVTYGADSFTIKPEGFWQSRIIVRDAKSNEVLATHHKKWRMEETHFPNGRVFSLKQRGFFQQRWEFLAPDNDVVLSVNPIKGFLKSHATLSLPDSAAKYPEVRVLLPLAWYLRLAAQRQAAATAAGA